MKICLVCFDFKESNIRLQPWRYIYEISNRMRVLGVDVKIISNGYPILPQKEDIQGVSVHRLKRLRSFPFAKNRGLISVIEKESPDAILWSIGATSFYFIRTLKKIDKPIVGLWMGTTYSLKEIIGLGLSEMTRNFSFIYIHIVNTLIPSFLIKYVLKSPNLKGMIVLNENNKKSIVNYGFSPDKISVIPPGVTDYDLEVPDRREVEKLRKEIGLEDNSFIVLYLGSPLSLRGVDTLIKAIARVYKNIPPLKLILLLRAPPNDLSTEEQYIRDVCMQKRINNRTIIVSGFLNKNDIKINIALSNVVALPFKLVQSDTPISFLEVMALGKTVVSTKVDGIPELLNGGRGYLVDPNDQKDLANAISTLYSNPQLRTEIGGKAREYMLKHPTWEQITQNIVAIINKIVDQNPNIEGTP